MDSPRAPNTPGTPETRRDARPASRGNVFAVPHQMLRYMLANLLAAMGRTSFGDPEQVDAVLNELSAVLTACDGHIAHEDQHLRPVLVQRAPSTVVTLDEEHSDHARHVEELGALAASLRDAQAIEERKELGRTLSLHYSVFVATTLVHSAYEERVVQALLERLLSAQELEAIQGAVLASIPAHEMVAWLRWIMPAADRESRAALATQIRANAPSQVFAALMSELRSVLSPADLADLERRIGA